MIEPRRSLLSLRSDRARLAGALSDLDRKARDAETKKAGRLAARQRDNTLDRYSELQEQLDTAQATFKIETVG